MGLSFQHLSFLSFFFLFVGCWKVDEREGYLWDQHLFLFHFLEVPKANIKKAFTWLVHYSCIFFLLPASWFSCLDFYSFFLFILWAPRIISLKHLSGSQVYKNIMLGTGHSLLNSSLILVLCWSQFIAPRILIFLSFFFFRILEI